MAVATISPASRAPRASRDASALRRRRGAGGASARRCAPRAQASDTDDAPLQFNGFDTLALHAGYTPDPEVTYGLGQGAPRGVPVYRTAPYQFKDTEHGANRNTDRVAARQPGTSAARVWFRTDRRHFPLPIINSDCIRATLYESVALPG